VSGVSDPDVFEWIREHGYTLKIHPELHAKVYSWDLDTALIGSSNLTNSGMGLSSQSNVEVLHGPTTLSVKSQFKLWQTENEAQLVTKDDYQKALEYLENTATKQPDYGNIDIGETPKFLVSQLPMTEEPDVLTSVLAKDPSRTLEDIELEERQCILHDVATFSLEGLRGEPQVLVREGVKHRFLDHEFIKMIVKNMNPYIYFGEMKAIVQEECVDVPTPTRRELTENIQILYNWFPKVAPNRFDHDVPESHSERLCDANKM
jgi:hypothetical protein